MRAKTTVWILALGGNQAALLHRHRLAMNRSCPASGTGSLYAPLPPWIPLGEQPPEAAVPQLRGGTVGPAPALRHAGMPRLRIGELVDSRWGLAIELKPASATHKLIELLQEHVPGFTPGVTLCGWEIPEEQPPMLPVGLWMRDHDANAVERWRESMPQLRAEIGDFSGMELTAAVITSAYENELYYEIRYRAPLRVLTR